ncbi:hypothetical protein [Anatilimnocola aggregata]|nr:hypothetical protein [Anatilimnocola aggregata]
MLSFAPMDGNYLSAEEAIEPAETLLSDRGRGLDSQLPEFELPPLLEQPNDSEKIPLPDLPDWQEPIPPPPEDNPSNDQSGDGGMVDLGNGFENTPADEVVPDVMSERESREVIEMLASLKYLSVNRDAVSSASLEDQVNETDKRDSRFESDELDKLNYFSRHSDGGSIEIAVDELVAEMEPARPAAVLSMDSLLEISVQMDNSSGRYQAFEVLTGEEVSLPSEVPEAEQADALFVPTSLTDDLGAIENDAATDTQEGDGSLLANTAIVNGEPSSLETAPKLAAGLMAGGERGNPTWSTAIALVTIGVVFQFLREQKTAHLRSCAILLWQSFVSTYRTLSRRTCRIDAQCLERTANSVAPVAVSRTET